MKNNNMSKWRIAEASLGYGGVVAMIAAILLSAGLWIYYPSVDNRKSYDAVKMINHGRILYVDYRIYYLHEVLLWGGGFMFFLAALIDFYKNPFLRNWSNPRK